ncbi:hypothetical protein Tco_0180592 [Tanacetum coccineum]
MLVYIDQPIAEGVEVIKQMKKVFLNMTDIFYERGAFLEELEKLRCSADAMHSATFLHDIQRRDVEKSICLLLMIKQLQLQTSKNVSFLRKLRGFWFI